MNDSICYNVIHLFWQKNRRPQPHRVNGPLVQETYKTKLLKLKMLDLSSCCVTSNKCIAKVKVIRYDVKRKIKDLCVKLSPSLFLISKVQ